MFVFSHIRMGEKFLGKDDELVEVASLEGKALLVQRNRTSCQEVNGCENIK